MHFENEINTVKEYYQDVIAVMERQNHITIERDLKSEKD